MKHRLRATLQDDGGTPVPNTSVKTNLKAVQPQPPEPCTTLTHGN